MTGLTDNLGNAFAVARLMTSKFPSVVILAELAEQLRARQAELSLQWIPRDQNEEADDLTNSEFRRFRLDRRIPVEVESMKWLVMDSLMRSAEDIYQVVKAARDLRGSAAVSSESGGRRGKRRPEERLRAREPW